MLLDSFRILIPENVENITESANFWIFVNFGVIVERFITKLHFSPKTTSLDNEFHRC